MTAKTKPKKEAEVIDFTAAKEARGRAVGSPFTGRGPRPAHPDPSPLEDVDKTAWKESRNRHPSATTVPRNRPEPVEVEPDREMTPDEIRAKEDRGHVR